MFKPTLKRSKNERTPFVRNTPSRPYGFVHQFIPFVEQPKSSLKSSVIVPSQLLEEYPPIANKPYTHLLNPLASTFHEYPQIVQQSLLKNGPEVSSRDAGSFGQLFWYYSNEIITVWREGEKGNREYSFGQTIRCVQVGQMHDVAIHFKNNNLVLLAVARQNEVALFGVDLPSLQLTNLNLSYRLGGATIVQQIRFVGHNSILIAGDTGVLELICFQEKIVRKPIKASFIRKLVPPSLYWVNLSERKVQDLQVSGNCVFSLICRQYSRSWLKVKAKQLVHYLRDDPREVELVVEERFVQVYGIEKNGLSYRYTVNQEKIGQIMTHNFSRFSGEEMENGLHIRSIFVERGLLGIVTVCGYMVILKEDKEVYFNGEPFSLPKRLGVMGFFVEKSLNSPFEVEPRNNRVEVSLGFRNLTLLSDCLIYYDEDRIDVIKCENMYAKLVEKQGAISSREWAVFSKRGYYLVNRLEFKQVLLTYFYYRCHEEPDDTTYESNFNCLLENISKSLGYMQFCKTLLSILLHPDEAFRINHDFINHYIREELRGVPNKSYEEWLHKLSNAANASFRIVPSELILSLVWDLLIAYQHRGSREKIKEHQTEVKGAYWNALQSAYYDALKPLLQLVAEQCKGKLQQIQRAISLLERLCALVEEKKERQKKYKQGLYAKKRDENYTHDNSTQNFILNVVSTSAPDGCLHLQFIILQSLPKLKALLKVYYRLMEAGQSTPQFQNVLYNFTDQCILKDKILLLFDDNPDLLEQVALCIPELELAQDLKYLRWRNFKKTKEGNRSYQLDLTELATVISSNRFQETANILQNSPGKWLQVLLIYSNRCETESKDLILRHTIQEKNYLHSDIFGKDILAMHDQRSKYLVRESWETNLKVKDLLEKNIRNFITGLPSDYVASEKILDEATQLVALRADSIMNDYLESELANARLNDKIVILKSLRKTKEEPPSFWDGSLVGTQRKPLSAETLKHLKMI